MFVANQAITHLSEKKTRNSGNSLKANLVEGDDIIAVVVSQANMVTNSKNWVVNSSVMTPQNPRVG